MQIASTVVGYVSLMGLVLLTFYGAWLVVFNKKELEGQWLHAALATTTGLAFAAFLNRPETSYDSVNIFSGLAPFVGLASVLFWARFKPKAEV